MHEIEELKMNCTTLTQTQNTYTVQYTIYITLKSGSLSRFMQVEAVGSLSRSGPELAMQKGGYKS